MIKILLLSASLMAAPVITSEPTSEPITEVSTSETVTEENTFSEDDLKAAIDAAIAQFVEEHFPNGIYDLTSWVNLAILSISGLLGAVGVINTLKLKRTKVKSVEELKTMYTEESAKNMDNAKDIITNEVVAKIVPFFVEYKEVTNKIIKAVIAGNMKGTDGILAALDLLETTSPEAQSVIDNARNQLIASEQAKANAKENAKKEMSAITETQVSENEEEISVL